MAVAKGRAEHLTCTLERVVQRRRWLSASRVHALEPLRQSPIAQHCPTRYFEPDAQRGRQMFCEARLRRQVLLANSQGYYAIEQYWPREHLWRTWLTCVMFEQTFASFKVCTDASFKSAVFKSQFGYNFFVTKLFMFWDHGFKACPLVGFTSLAKAVLVVDKAGFPCDVQGFNAGTSVKMACGVFGGS